MYALTAGACGGDDALVLNITADNPATILRVEVKQAADQGAWTDRVELDPAGRGRDISDPAQAYRLAIELPASGRYGVHIVDISQGADAPLQSWAAFIDVDDAVERDAHLYFLEPGNDDDGDGWPEACPTSAPADGCGPLDCGDRRSDINPFGIEICHLPEGEPDEDCDARDECLDSDGDGYYPGDAVVPDCDDGRPDVHPGAPETNSPAPCNGAGDGTCGNGVDENCDGADAPCYTDADCDHRYPEGTGTTYDCDDGDPTIHGGAAELCGDGIDQDCDGIADDGCKQCDKDGDGYKDDDPECLTETDQPDCDDADRLIHPGSTSDCGDQEGAYPCSRRGMCDGRDDDCDGVTDEGCPGAACDADSDGFPATVGCGGGTAAADCDDTDPHVYPGAPEICGDGVAQNCSIDLPCTTDEDGDGYLAGVDCDDQRAAVNPGATELCDGLDNDCDGVIDEGNPPANPGDDLSARCTLFDQGECGKDDGRCICSPAPQPQPVAGDATQRQVCPGEDAAAAWAPRCFALGPALEVCDPLDQDCDGDSADLDESFLGSACTTPPNQPCQAGTVTGCDPTASTTSSPNSYYLNPYWVCEGAIVPTTERCNYEDDDCDGATDDGFAVDSACDGNDGDLCLDGHYVCSSDGGGVTCVDPSDAAQQETCNTVDDDCDGATDNNLPGPFYTACGESEGECSQGTWQCVDGAQICSGGVTATTDICDHKDNDCDGTTDEDFPTLGQSCDGADADLCHEGVIVCTGSGQTQCNDSTGNSAESCNGADDDCDGATDEDFPTLGQSCDGPDTDQCKEGIVVCSGGTAQCNDATASTVETCNDADDDCDGATDEDFALGQSCQVGEGACLRTGTIVCKPDGTAACNASPGTGTDETCNDIDDDCNGLTDDGDLCPASRTCVDGVCS